MPYTVRRRGDEWCVYKIEGGRASGNTLGCHATKSGARRQIAAIEANESKALIVRGKGAGRYMFLITSNGYSDREGEVVTVAALRDYARRLERGRLPQWLDFEHGPIIGKIVAADMWGPFLVEVAKELDNEKAKRRWDFIEATPFLDWACSQQFLSSMSDKMAGTFRKINKQRSTVIRRGRAANVLTGAGIIGAKKWD
jgi:hypothetical protein